MLHLPILLHRYIILSWTCDFHYQSVCEHSAVSIDGEILETIHDEARLAHEPHYGMLEQYKND